MPILRLPLSGDANSLAAKVASGRLYTLVDETASLASAGIIELCLRTADEVIEIEVLSLGSTSIETSVELREGVVFTDATGTTLTSYNRNRNYKAIPLPVDNAEKNPTVTNQGTLIEDFTVFGESGGGGNKPAFSSGSITVPYILEPNSTYMLRITNNDASARDYRAALYLSY